MKPVLLFAHRGEAHAFFQHDQLRPLVQNEFQLYETDRYFLLITHEGFQDTTENLTWFLTKYSDLTSGLINLGLAGALDSQLEQDKIYAVKTIYGEEQFKSFQTALAPSGIDLISAKNRVLKKTEATKLAMTAKLVDREAWAIASVAKKFKQALTCYKIVSDYAGSDNLCELIREKSEALSENLYQFYQTLTPEHARKSESSSFNLPGFHLTFTQEKQLETLLHRLSLKEKQPPHSFLVGEMIEKIHELKQSPKEKTQTLIYELGLKLNPFKKDFEQQLNQATLPLTQIGCRLKFTEHFENKNFTISMPIENEKNFKNLKEALAQTSYADITKVLDGDF